MRINLRSVAGEVADVEIHDFSELAGKVFEHFPQRVCGLRFLSPDGEVLDGTRTLQDGDEVTFVRQDLPVVAISDGDIHWTEETAPALEANQVAALINSDNERLKITRQCVKAAFDYRIHFCRSPEISTAVRTVEVDKAHIAVIHRKTGASHGPGAKVDAEVSYETVADGSLSCRLLFEGGFPHGGECYADIHAPWGTCYTDIPPGGSLILEIPWP
eukprot:Skav216956  [mRNA]  locus=scaffold2531:23783:24430:+ [translate_table: standard]